MLVDVDGVQIPHFRSFNFIQELVGHMGLWSGACCVESSLGICSRRRLLRLRLRRRRQAIPVEEQ